MSIRVTQGDNNTLLVVNLQDHTRDDSPLNVSAATVRLNIRPELTTTLSTSITGVLLAGVPLGDGTFDMTDATPGYGGRVQFRLTSSFTSLDVGRYLGEIEISYASGDIVTVYDMVKLNLVAQV